MAKVGEMIESKYLKQSDVDEEALVTIVKVGRANIAKENDEPEYKWLIKFKEFPKPMVLNSTNIKRLARACNSEDTDEWTDRQVVLYIDHDVEFAGQVVGGLRIKAAVKPRTATDLAKDAAAKHTSKGGFDKMDDDIPFSQPFRGMLYHVV